MVDDESSLRLVVRLNLSLADFEVVEAADVESGYERAREQAFDLFLIDVMMPPTSGFELAERLRSDPTTREVPIVFLSARADRTDIDRGLELGAADYITKPFDPLALAARLNSLIGGKEASDGR